MLHLFFLTLLLPRFKCNHDRRAMARKHKQTATHDWLAWWGSATQCSQQLRSSLSCAVHCLDNVQQQRRQWTQPNQCRLCWEESWSMKPKTAQYFQQKHFTFAFKVFGRIILLFKETYLECPWSWSATSQANYGTRYPDLKRPLVLQMNHVLHVHFMWIYTLFIIVHSAYWWVQQTIVILSQTAIKPQCQSYTGNHIHHWIRKWKAAPSILLCLREEVGQTYTVRYDQRLFVAAAGTRYTLLRHIAELDKLVVRFKVLLVGPVWINILLLLFYLISSNLSPVLSWLEIFV